MEFAIRHLSEHVKHVYRTCLPVQGPVESTSGILKAVECTPPTVLQ